MKTCALFFALFTGCFAVNAQNLDSLFENGRNKEIVEIYKAAPRTFDNNELETIAAAYDKSVHLDEEDEVLYKIITGFPLLLTYSAPANYLLYGNFIKAGLMEKYKTSITRQYLASIKDTALGRLILAAFYRDQSIREKYDDNKYSKRYGQKINWDSAGLISEWVRIDSFNAVLIAEIISYNKGFPSRTNIGLIGTNSLFILMQHLNTNLRGRYERFLFDAACRSDISMTDYAMYRTMTLVRTHQIPDSLFQNTLDSLSEIKCK